MRVHNLPPIGWGELFAKNKKGKNARRVVSAVRRDIQ